MSQDALVSAGFFSFCEFSYSVDVSVLRVLSLYEYIMCDMTSFVQLITHQFSGTGGAIGACCVCVCLGVRTIMTQLPRRLIVSFMQFIKLCQFQ